MLSWKGVEYICKKMEAQGSYYSYLLITIILLIFAV